MQDMPTGTMMVVSFVADVMDIDARYFARGLEGGNGFVFGVYRADRQQMDATSWETQERHIGNTNSRKTVTRALEAALDLMMTDARNRIEL